MDSPVLETLGSVIGSMFGSGGVVWLVMRAALSDMEVKFEKRLIEERKWAEESFQRKHA